MNTTKETLNQIKDYLTNGGLFNPELANHDVVRDLILECRDQITELQKFKERMEWLHTGGGTDAEGYEWGIYRVKWPEVNEKCPGAVKQTLADFSDLDREMKLDRVQRQFKASEESAFNHRFDGLSNPLR